MRSLLPLKKVRYFAAHTDSDCLVGCSHEHKTVISAAACISAVGGYVIAIDKHELRALNEKEEAEFQRARYGSTEPEKLQQSSGLLVAHKLEPMK